MRVISGSRKGAKLHCLPGEGVRPTTDRVKENIFNLIQFDIMGRTALDLFAGSGALGLEALSRGADSAVFVEENRAAWNVVKRNAEELGFSGRASVVLQSYESYLKSCNKQFDLVFLDPPYHKGMLTRALFLLKNLDLLAPGALLIAECDGDETPGFSGFTVLKQRQYGRVKITLLASCAEELASETKD